MFRRGSYEIRTPPPREVAESGGGGAGGVETVTSLTARIKAVLESEVQPCWVRGEISNVRQQASGHVYFSLKDASAQIACVMFRGDIARSSAGRALRDGAQIVVFGELSVYEVRGSYQLIVRVAVDDGLGRLQQEFERLKERLAAEGLFDPASKKTLPIAPRTIGLITSPTGAAVQDFIRILKRREWRGRLVVLPAKVQGEGAAAEMVRALELAQSLVRAAGAGRSGGVSFELLVVGRGGGSLEDLWAFNEEPLVRAVAACEIPIISAVGHEIDFTLCDFAADVRAETPSAAAELITSRYLDACERTHRALEAAEAAIARHMRELRDALEIVRGRLALASPAARVEQAHLRLDDLGNRLDATVRHALQERGRAVADAATALAHVSPQPLVMRARERFRGAAARLERESAVWLARKREGLARIQEKLTSLGPEAVLRRGYTIIRDRDTGAPVVSREALRSGQRVQAQFHDGPAPLQAE